MASDWKWGRVKAVPSGDSLAIHALQSKELNLTFTLQWIRAPKLGCNDGATDEPFAWDSREFLRKLCLGKEVLYRVDAFVEPLGFVGTVYIGNHNVAELVVQKGWAVVTSVGNRDLEFYGDQACNKGLGLWSKVPGSAEASIRTLPPKLDLETTNSLLAANKGKLIKAIVEKVCNGSSIVVHLLPEFHLVPVIVAGALSPYVGTNSAKHYPFAEDAKFFTESCVLNRDVHIVLEGVDKSNRLMGSVYYHDGDSEKDLGLELVENGYARYVPWAGSVMEEDPRRRLQSAEVEAKRNKINIWKHFELRDTNSWPIHHQNFTGTVVEVLSGDCIIVANESENRRVNLSSIWCPKMRNPHRGDEPDAYAREAKEFLRTLLIGRQVNVQMEYSKNVGQSDSGSSRVREFGSVFTKADEEDESEQVEENVAELVVASGFGNVIKHRDFEERSRYYDVLVAAESCAIAEKKGLHSSEEAPAVHMIDLTRATVEEAREMFKIYIPEETCYISLPRRRVSAVVEYVLSGHRFKLYIPKKTCYISFSLTGVRCPGRDEPYSDEAIAVMRRRIMQRDVEIEVENVVGNGTLLGTLWESGTNVSIPLVEAGLAKYVPNDGSDKMQDGDLLERAMQDAKTKKLKIWENLVVVTQVLDSGMFYVQTVGNNKSASIQQQLAALNLEEAPSLSDAFNPKLGDIVLAQFSADNSWNRARIVSVRKDRFEVFYIDYGNQEVVPHSQLRPLNSSAARAPGLAQLCRLAHVIVPSLEEEFGQEAGEHLSERTLGKEFTAVIEGRDTSGEKMARGQGSGPALEVTLIAADNAISINATMVQKGLASVEKSSWKSRTLRECQEKAKTFRRGMWHDYYESDHHSSRALPARKAAGKR